MIGIRRGCENAPLRVGTFLLTVMLALSGVPWCAGDAYADTGDEAARWRSSVDAALSYLGDEPGQTARSGSEGEGNVTVIVQLEPSEAQPAGQLGVQSGEDWRLRHERYKEAVRELVRASAGSPGASHGAPGNPLEALLQLMGAENVGDSVQDLYDYRNAIDGFACKVPADVVGSLKQLDGVKRVVVERVFQPDVADGRGASSAIGAAPSTALSPAAAEEPANQSSLDMTGADKVEQEGAGQVIAILDSGFDTDHDVFKGALDESKVAWSAADARERRSDCLQGGHDAVYVSAKVPFAYDYGDKDANVLPSRSGLEHGMHVAGIAAANGGAVRGAAPSAQVALLKVANDFTGSIYESSLLAALDDAVSLRPDVLSMSLGSDGGFSSEEAEVYGDVFAEFESRGCTVCVSAGNSYTSAKGNKSGAGLSYAVDPDQGITSGPASLDAAFAVGSLQNARPLPCFTASDGRQICYVDGSRGSLMGTVFADVEEGTYEYVDAGRGSSAECKAALEAHGLTSLRGKIALVEDLNVHDEESGALVMSGNRVENLARLRPVAIVMYDSSVDTPDAKGIGGCSRAVACIGHGDGVALKSAAVKTITVKHGVTMAPSPDYAVNAFSSWGTTPEMTLKPDIAAPGGDIYSSLPGNQYGYKSGTSMAAPHVAGLSALMREYVAHDAKFSGMHNEERAAVVSQLLMSTARPLKNRATGTGYYSPRQQGAGSANVQAAMASPVFLTVEGAEDGAHPKAQLGESAAGTWSFTVALHNLGESEQVFAPSTVALTEDVADGFFRQTEEDHAGADVAVSYSGAAYDDASGVVRVAAGSTALYTVTLACSDAFKALLDGSAPNGTFVEGFALLRAQSVGGVNLSVPYLGFYGDWSRAPVFDSAASADAGQAVHLYASNLASGTTKRPLGANPLGTDDDVDYKKAVVSVVDAEQAPNAVLPRIGMLRGVDELSFTYADEHGAAKRSYSYAFTSKCNADTPYLDDTRLASPPLFTGTDDDGHRVADGAYTLTVEAKTSGPGPDVQSERFNFVLDTRAPEISEVDFDASGKIAFTVKEDNYLAGVDFHDPATGAYFYRMLADDVAFAEDSQGERVYGFSIPRSDVLDAWVAAGKAASDFPETLPLYAWDYGLNAATAEVSAPLPAFDVDDAGTLLAYNGTSTVAEIPDSVTGIAKAAFKGSRVKSVVVPASVTAIGDEAFAETGSLEHVVFAGDDAYPSQLTSIGAKAFSGSAVRRIELPDGVKSLGAGVFADSKAAAVLLPESLKAVPDRAFAGSSVRSVTVPAGLVSVGREAFSGCDSLSALGFWAENAGEPEWAEGLPASVESISEKAFAGCALDKITLRDGLVSIAASAFAKSSVRELAVPDSVTALGARSLADMRKLVSVTLGEGVTAEQARAAFDGDTALKNIDVSASSTGLSSTDGVLLSADGTELVMFPTGRVGTYAVPGTVRVVGPSAFQGAEVENVSFGGADVVLGERSFAGSSVRDVDLTGVQLVGESAFANCRELEHVDFKAATSLRVIGQSAFSPKVPLSAVELPDNVTSVGAGAFANNAALEAVRLGAGFRDGYARVFAGCDNVARIDVAGGNPVYEADGSVLYAREDDGLHLVRSLPSGRLETLRVKSGTVAVDALAASGNADLVSVVLPEGLKTVGKAAFSGCSQLADVQFPDSLEAVSGFSGTALDRVELGTKVKEIESDAFNGRNPAYIVVNGGQSGTYASSFESSGNERPVQGAYFGEGMSKADFTASPIAPPRAIVVPSTMTSLKLNAASGGVSYDPRSVVVYAEKDTAGWKAARAALASIGADVTTQLKERRELEVSASAQLLDAAGSSARLSAQASGGACAAQSGIGQQGVRAAGDDQGYLYRFVQVTADGRESVVRDWSSDSSGTWKVVGDARVRCDVRDASGFIVSAMAATRAYVPAKAVQPAQPAQPKQESASGAQGSSANLARTAESSAASPIASVSKGQTVTVAGQSFKVTKTAVGSVAGTVTFAKAKNAKKVTVPATVKLADGKAYKVTKVAAKAFVGKKIRSIVIGKNVKTLSKGAFTSSKAKKVTVKSRLLKTRKSLLGAFKSSNVKTVKLSGMNAKQKKAVKRAIVKWGGKKGIIILR